MRLRPAEGRSGPVFWTGLQAGAVLTLLFDTDLCLFYTLLAVMAAAHRMKAFNCNQLDLWLL